MRLTPDIPIALKVTTGAGDSTVDLERINLTDLELHLGVGQTTATLPATGKFSAKIDGGIGSLVINIPAGMAAQIRTNSGLGQVDVSSDFLRQGDVYTSPGYETATNRIDMVVDVGIGSITVKTFAGD